MSLEKLADVSTTVTAIVAVYGYIYYRLIVYRRMWALEKVLATKNKPNDDSLTLRQLAIAIKATEDQVIEAAGKSRKIRGIEGMDGEYRLQFI